MADLQVGNVTGVAAAKGKNINGGDDAQNSFKDTTSAGALNDVANARARLTAIDSTTYTAVRLNHMTLNDMRYAIRLLDDPSTVR